MAIIGIDLGTTNSLAAGWRNGTSELIPNSLGEYLTPSVVSVDSDGTILVGAAARDRLITHPEHTAAGFKRSMAAVMSWGAGCLQRRICPLLYCAACGKTRRRT